MIEYPVMDAGNREVRQATLLDQIFGRPVRADLLARIVNYQLAGRRGGNASTKVRSDVRGGGRKPFRQKGTGNARQGTIRAPQARGGGIVFGPHPHSYATKLPKKERRLGLQVALSAKREAGELVIVENFGLEQIQTKAMLAILSALGVGRTTLIVLDQEDRAVELSARNLPGVDIINEVGVNVYGLLAHETVVMTEAALNKLQERLA